MNLSMFRSGKMTVVHAECITGYAFTLAAVGEESAHFYEYAAAAGLSFVSTGAVI